MLKSKPFRMRAVLLLKRNKLSVPIAVTAGRIKYKLCCASICLDAWKRREVMVWNYTIFFFGNLFSLENPNHLV